MAPEMVQIKPQYGTPCDIWALGCVFYQMIEGKRPFKGESIGDIFNKIREATYNKPEVATAACADLIGRMLTKDPAKRWTA